MGTKSDIQQMQTFLVLIIIYELVAPFLICIIVVLLSLTVEDLFKFNNIYYFQVTFRGLQLGLLMVQFMILRSTIKTHFLLSVKAVKWKNSFLILVTLSIIFTLHFMVCYAFPEYWQLY